MSLSLEQKNALGIALNEACLLGVEIDPKRRRAAITFQVLTLPSIGGAPSDRRVQLLLSPVGRVAGLLRDGLNAHDDEGRVVALRVEDILPTVTSFGGLPVYGWEFIDVHDTVVQRWRGRSSIDWRSDLQGGETHSLFVFQEGGTRDLDLCIWFDNLEIRRPDNEPLSLEAFCEGGKRWWDALYAGDPRADGFGIVPGRRDDA